MTDYIDADIQNALLTNLTTPSLGFPTAYPFVPFVPKQGVAYIEARPLMKAKTQHPGLGYDDTDLNRAVFQIDAVIPDGKGELAGLRMQGQIAERFRLGTALPFGNRWVKINAPPQTTGGMKDGAWVRFPVSITVTVVASPQPNDFDSEYANDFN